MKKWILSAALLMSSTTAFAYGPPPGRVVVDNDTNRPIEVYVDGRYLGRLGGDRTSTFRVEPGHHKFVVRNARNGNRIETEWRWVEPHRSTRIEVDRRSVRAPLVVHNDGRARLHVRIGNTTVWLTPGQTRTLYVDPGNVSVVSSTWRGGRLVQVDNRRVLVDRRRPARASIRWASSRPAPCRF